MLWHQCINHDSRGRSNARVLARCRLAMLFFSLRNWIGANLQFAAGAKILSCRKKITLLFHMHGNLPFALTMHFPISAEIATFSDIRRVVTSRKRENGEEFLKYEIIFPRRESYAAAEFVKEGEESPARYANWASVRYS